MQRLKIVVVYGNVTDVSYMDGATIIKDKSDNFTGNTGAVTLGNFIVGGSELDNGIINHEYGHYLQSRVHGILYLFSIGLSSIISAGEGENHDDFWTEVGANRRHFQKLYKEGNDSWDDTRFHLNYRLANQPSAVMGRSSNTTNSGISNGKSLRVPASGSGTSFMCYLLQLK